MQPRNTDSICMTYFSVVESSTFVMLGRYTESSGPMTVVSSNSRKDGVSDQFNYGRSEGGESHCPATFRGVEVRRGTALMVSVQCSHTNGQS